MLKKILILSIFLIPVFSHASACTYSAPTVPCTTADGGTADSAIYNTGKTVFYENALYNVTIDDPGTTGFYKIVSKDGISKNSSEVFIGSTSIGKFTETFVNYTSGGFNAIGTGSNTIFKTRIISFTPENGTTTATTTVNFNGHFYINPDDLTLTTGIFINYRNINQNTILGNFNPFEDDEFSIFYGYATSSGHMYVSTTTVLEKGNYRVEVSIADTVLGVPVPFTEVYDVQYHNFKVIEGTWIGEISANSLDGINDIFASTTATSTYGASINCFPFSGQWDTVKCIGFLFIPDAGSIYTSINNLEDEIKLRFPFGYATHFREIMASSSEIGLPILEATVPNGIIGTGAHLELDLNHSLDYILYATSSIYQSPESDAEVTFYDYTSFYWNYILYFLAALYIIRRIIGSELIPDIP